LLLLIFIEVTERSCFPKENRQLAKLQEDIFLGLMNHMRSEIFTNDAIPTTSILIHLCFKISRKYSLLLILF